MYEIMWKNVVEVGRWQMTIWCMLSEAGYLRLQYTHTHTGCVKLIAFPQQQWLHKRASVSRTYIAPLVICSHDDHQQCLLVKAISMRDICKALVGHLVFSKLNILQKKKKQCVGYCVLRYRERFFKSCSYPHNRYRCMVMKRTDVNQQHDKH